MLIFLYPNQFAVAAGLRDCMTDLMDYAKRARYRYFLNSSYKSKIACYLKNYIPIKLFNRRITLNFINFCI